MTTYQIDILNPQAEKILQELEDRKLIFISGKNSASKLYSAQKEMLMMSEADIAYERIVSEEELEKLDEEWLN